MESLNPCCFCQIRSASRDLKAQYTRLGVTEIYSEMFEDCFRIQLLLDNENNGICEVCVARLQDASDFKRQAVRSHAELRERLYRHLEDESSMMNESGDSKVRIKEEFLMYGEPTIETELGEETIERHIDPFSPSVPTSDLFSASKPNGTSEQLGTTSETQRTIDQTSSLAIHGTDMHDNSSGITIEVPISDTRGDQNEPKISLTKQAQIYSKPAPAPDQTDSNKINKRTRGTKTFICDVCDKTFSQSCNLKRHKLIHTGEKPYACTICGHKFTNPTGLKNHQYVHTGVRLKPHSCEICDKRYAQLNMLKAHQRVHSGEKPFKCELCSKLFRVMGDLKIHTKKHHTAGEKHACGLCEKQFFRKSDLTLHMTKHSGQQPYACRVCQKKFLYGNDLRRHVLIHTGEKPYTCDMCNAGFRQKVNMIKHIRSNVCKNIKCKKQETIKV